MATYDISASKRIPAPAENIYHIIADYEHEHPKILPKPYFVGLSVEKGGYGEGTVIDFQMKILGRTQSFYSHITEPKPGQVLVETDVNTGAATTFRIEPSADHNRESLVTITTTIPVPAGIRGKIQGWFAARLLRPIYLKELDQLAALATGK